MDAKAMGRRIQELRKAKGLTQSQLAVELGVSMAAVRNYENGLREPNSKAMAALESYFNVSGAYLRGTPATSILSTYATDCLRTASAGATPDQQQDLPSQISGSSLKERKKTVHELIDKMSNEEFEKVWKFLQWTDLLHQKEKTSPQRIPFAASGWANITPENDGKIQKKLQQFEKRARELEGK